MTPVKLSLALNMPLIALDVRTYLDEHKGRKTAKSARIKIFREAYRALRRRGVVSPKMSGTRAEWVDEQGVSQLDENIMQMEFSDTDDYHDRSFGGTMTSFAFRPDSATSDSGSDTSVNSSEAKALWLASDPGYIDISDSDVDTEASTDSDEKTETQRKSQRQEWEATPRKSKSPIPSTSKGLPSQTPTKSTPAKSDSQKPGPLSVDFDDPEVCTKLCHKCYP